MTNGKALVVLVLACAVTLPACGDDGDGDGGGEGPAKLSVTATDTSLEVSASPAPGVTEVTLRNDGRKDAAAQLIRVEGNHSKQEVLRVYRRVAQGGSIPDWFQAEGGAGTTPAGKTTLATQELEAGEYYAVNDQGDVTAGKMAGFEVSGEATDAKLPSASTVTAREYKFETKGIAAGEPIAFKNRGAQPHHLVALPLKAGKTAKDAARFIETEKGPSPIAGDSAATAVIDGDRTIVTDLGLTPGNYALVCFITDREGGPPHSAKGMITGAKVK